MNKFIRFAVSAVILTGFYSWGYTDAKRRFAAKPEIGGGGDGGGEPAPKSEVDIEAVVAPHRQRASALYEAGVVAVNDEFNAAWDSLQRRGDVLKHEGVFVGPTMWFEPLVHKFDSDEAVAGKDHYGRKYLVGRDLVGDTVVFFEREVVQEGGTPLICTQTRNISRRAVENPTESVATMRLWRAAH